MKYYEVLVELKIESENRKGGVNIKKIKETYLVDALSVTEAEARIVIPRNFLHFRLIRCVINNFFF